MTKWSQFRAIIFLAAIPAVLVASARPAQSAAKAGDEPKSGNQILLEAANAAGGEKLSSVVTLAISESGKIMTSQGDTTLSVTWMVAYPDRSRGEVDFGGQHVVQVCDGTSAWLQLPQGTRDTTPVISEFKRGISLFGGGWGVYEQVLAGKMNGEFIGETDIDGKKTLGVSIDGPFGPVKLYFDPTTHLLSAARFQSTGAQGTSDNEQRWSDYRTVDGRVFAFSTVTYRDGTKFFESTIQDVRLNPKVEESLFAKPAPAVNN